MPVFLVPVDASEENADKEAEVTNQEIIVGRSFLVFNVSVVISKLRHYLILMNFTV